MKKRPNNNETKLDYFEKPSDLGNVYEGILLLIEKHQREKGIN